jgi:predicted nuclease of predicted toxin-antitoxin system
VRILLDTCVWGGAKAELVRHGHDVVWAGDWPEDPGDDVILERAHRENRLFVTLDKDFGELAVVRRVRHAGMVRLAGIRAQQQGLVVEQIISRYRAELEKGALVTVQAGRVRIRSGEA